MSRSFKKTIAGKIPTDWNALLIKAFSSVVRGGSPRPAGSPKYFNGDFIPWITVADVTRADGMYLTKTKSMLTEEGAKHTRIIEPDTLLISNSGATLGVPKIARIRAGANDGVAMILSPDGVANTYLYHFLSSKTDFLREHAAPGNGQPNLNTDIIGGIAVPIPPLPEQTAIVSLLSTWDLAIEKTERLVAVKERYYLWLSKKHLFGDAADTANTSKKTKWFSVPGHWKIVNIGKIASEVSLFNSSGESIPVLSCTKYDGLVDSLTYFDKQVFSQDTSTYKVVAKGQFAYATNHVEEGSIGYQDIYDKGLVSPMYTAFETNKNIDDSYLYKVLKSVVYLHIFRANTSSSVDRRGSLRWKEFAKLPIPLPPIEEQKQIAAILTTARQEIDLLKRQADAYRRQKRGLMQRLLTGEWRVRVG